MPGSSSPSLPCPAPVSHTPFAPPCTVSLSSHPLPSPAWCTRRHYSRHFILSCLASPPIPTPSTQITGQSYTIHAPLTSIHPTPTSLIHAYFHRIYLQAHPSRSLSYAYSLASHYGPTVVLISTYFIDLLVPLIHPASPSLAHHIASHLHPCIFPISSQPVWHWLDLFCYLAIVWFCSWYPVHRSPLRPPRSPLFASSSFCCT